MIIKNERVFCRVVFSLIFIFLKVEKVSHPCNKIYNNAFVRTTVHNIKGQNLKKKSN